MTALALGKIDSANLSGGQKLGVKYFIVAMVLFAAQIVFGLLAGDYEWVKRRQTPHPGHTYDAVLNFDPQRVAAVPRTFVTCTQPALATLDAIRPRLADSRFWDGAWQGGGGARVVELKTGHDPMISAPAELTRILLDCAA